MKLCFLITLFSLVSQTHCSRILALSPFGTQSHKFSMYPILEALASKGHNMTLVSSFSPKESRKNIHEIVLPTYVDEDLFETVFKIRKLPTAIKGIGGLASVAISAEKIFHSLMVNEEFQQVLREKSVDLILVDAVYNDFCMPIIEYLKVPFVLVASAHPFPWYIEALGEYGNLAIYPRASCYYGRDMSFLERVNNFIIYHSISLARRYVFIPKIETFTKEHFPNQSSITEIEKKASLLLTPTHPASNWPRPLPPTIIELGPLHCGQLKPLPEDLKRIADDSSEHGFIIFSLGSVMRKSAVLEKYFDVFVKVFAKIPQKVIWKWETEIETPPNVYLTSWVPQQDLLGHPHARLFISHCGFLSIQEAIYHGVPVLGLPIAFDQPGNAAKLVYEGMALRLDWDELTDEAIVFRTVTALVNNSSFRSNAQRLSRIMRDTLVPGKEMAVHWIEHIMRHNGTSHLRLNNTLSWYQYNSLDVAIFITFLTLCLCAAAIILCRKTSKYLIGCKTPPVPAVKKNQ